MKKPPVPLLLFLALLTLAPALISADKTYQKIKNFGQITVTSNEALYLDLNEYFTGDITSFSVDPPLSLPASKFVKTNGGTFYTGVNNIISVDAPKDNFGNWDPSQNWIMLDSANTILVFTPSGPQDSPTITFLQNSSTPFYQGAPTDYKCGSMMRNNPETLVVSCLPSGDTPEKVQYFFINIADLTVTGQIPEPMVGTSARSIQRFSALPTTLFITVPKANPPQASIISSYDITNPADPQRNRTFSASLFNNVSSFVIQTVSAVANTSIYFAEQGGIIYRADNPFADKPKTTSFNVNDQIKEMTVVYEAFHGSPKTILAVQTPTSIYTIDWTDFNNPAILNKYALAPLKEEIISVISLDISQDFLSCIVSTPSSTCRMLVYYLGPSLPGDVYYLQDCPMATYQIKKERSTSSFFFMTADSPKLDFSIYQLMRSLLKVQSNNVGALKPKLALNGDLEEPLNVNVIGPKDYGVYLSNPDVQASYGLTVPGQSTFDITCLLNGPFLSYTSNDTNYNVVPSYTSLTFNGSSKDSKFAVYSKSDGSTVYWFSWDAEHVITLQTCVSKGGAYTCTSKNITFTDPSNLGDVAEEEEEEEEGEDPPVATITAVAASQKYFYIYDKASCTIKAFDANLKEYTKLVVHGPQDDGGNCRSCNQLLSSQDPLAPFIYCLTDENLYFARNDIDGVNLTPLPSNPCTVDVNTTMHLNHNFPTMVFYQCQLSIYLIETFTWALSVPPITSNITIDDPQNGGYSFGIGGNSLLVLLKQTQSLLEYDISHPKIPVLIKTLPYYDYYYTQILSDSQNSDLIYIYGQYANTYDPMAIIYRPQKSGNSNYLTAIPLPNPPFDPNNPSLVFPPYPAIKQASGSEMFLVPVAKNFGWTVKPTILVDFSTTSSSDPNATDYLKTVNVLFTGTHNGKTKDTNSTKVNVSLILTDEPVRSTKNLVYTGVSLNDGTNHVPFDPRTYFNGVIQSYTALPQNKSETSMVTITPQVNQETSVNLGVNNLYNLLIVNNTFIANNGTEVFLDTAGDIKTITITDAAKTAYSCQDAVYNSYISELLLTCFNPKTSTYSFAFLQFTDDSVVGPMIVAATARKAIANIQKVAFTASAIFVLENVDGVGSYIHIFNFTAPQEIHYQDSITGADLNTGDLAVTDFSVNYMGALNEYRILLIDSNSGIRSLDVYFTENGLQGLRNAQLHPLPYPPANAIWNGISTVSEQGDLGLPIDLVVTSPNYKNYYLRYTAQTASNIQEKRVFIPPPNSYITNSCFADGKVFLFSAYDGKTNYALLYYISDLTSTANGQNFPLLTVPYKPPVTGACSFHAQAHNDSYSFFISGADGTNINNYTVNSTIDLVINGKLTSDYITISASGSSNKDSLNFYLRTPPDPTPSYLIVWLILGGIAAIIVIVLLCYCNIKYKRSRDSNASEYRRGVNDESFQAP